MTPQRKRFRIEDLFATELSETNIMMPGASSDQHREVMAELRAIREAMGKTSQTPAGSGVDLALLETYKAQIAQCEKLKIELDLINESIDRTKMEIAALHGKSFDGTEMKAVTCELGAVVGGTEEATQSILESAEQIDQSAAALGKSQTPAQRTQLTQEIQEHVVKIFEACNFQDLTGQRINKVMNTMKYIEHHISIMMDIWGGMEEIRKLAPEAPAADPACDKRFLNGPRLDGDEGHASQDDIDALFN